jgi:hypothetical protein
MVLAIAAPAAPRYTISREQIAAAVRDAGMPVSAEQVAPLADVVSSVSAPQLRVRSIEPGGGRQTAVRIECVRSAECLPFVVTIQTDRNTSSPSVPLELHTLSANRPVIRSGATVVLYLDSGRVHVSMTAICLDNGAVGQTVRATTTDRRKTYLAQVVDSSSLKGAL